MTAIGAAGAVSAPAVELVGLSKRFGDLWAVRGVDLTLLAGEIHALLGENGAGKSTLMGCLAGLHRPDGGRLAVGGKTVAFRSPREAMAAGVGMVHQHFMLVPTLSVAENVLLGAARIPVLLRPRRQRRLVQEAAERLGLRVEASARVNDLSVGEQQRVEILRVLVRGARVLILDEPTAVLAPDEIEALFRSLRLLADGGATVVLISHKLEEVRRVAHRLTVLRRGEVVARLADPARHSASEIAAMMVGREIALDLTREPSSPGPVLLRLEGLRVRSDRGPEAVCGVDLELRAGEILGLAGVAGNGQPELIEAIAGLRPVAAGRILLADQDLARVPVRARAARGLRLVPEDRHQTGTAPSLSVAENLLLRDYYLAPCRRRGGLLDLRIREGECRQRIDALQIATTGPEQEARLLSGGNLQKVILARELAAEARIILALQPTRGLDAWATAMAHRLLLDARRRGAAVLLCSEDLEEVLALADRVAVLASGRISLLLPGEAADRVTVGRAMIAPTSDREGNHE